MAHKQTSLWYTEITYKMQKRQKNMLHEFCNKEYDIFFT